MADIKEEFDRIIKSQPCSLVVNDIDTFGQRVLYAKVKPNPIDIYDNIDAMVQNRLGMGKNISSTNRFQSIPHMTIVKVSRPVARLRNSKYLPSSLYEKFRGSNFGVQPLNNLKLCLIDAETGCDGFYETIQSTDFNQINLSYIHAWCCEYCYNINKVQNRQLMQNFILYLLLYHWENGALNYDEGEEITICSYVIKLFISSTPSRFTCLLVSKPCYDIYKLCMDEEINIRSQRNLSQLLFNDIFTYVFDVNDDQIYTYDYSNHSSTLIFSIDINLHFQCAQHN